MARPRRHEATVTADARERWLALRWFVLPLAEMPPETRELAEQCQEEMRRLRALDLTDDQRCSALLDALDDLKPGLRRQAEDYLRRCAEGS